MSDASIKFFRVEQWRKLAVFLAFLFFLIAIITNNLWVGSVLFLIFILFIYFSAKPALALYVLAGVSFFSGWFIVMSKYEWAKFIPVISNLNAPIADFFGVFAIACLALAWFLPKSGIRRIHFKNIPHGLYWYGLFLIAAGVSVSIAYDKFYTPSLYYLLRMMVFVVPAFIFVPYVVACEENIVRKILKIWFVVGLAISVYGISSLFVLDFQSIPRVTPYEIRGFAPLGFNHNQLAETLVVIIPLGIYLAFSSQSKKNYFRFFIAGTLLMILTVLLTLSRAAWVALLVECVLALHFYKKEVREWFNKTPDVWILGAAVAIAIAGYMFYFLTTGIVKSSTTSRLSATQVTIYYFKRSPLFGYGPGMYTRILGDSKAYVMDYGDPLEAHGFVQKILLEEGLVGLAIFIIFLITMFRYLWRAQMHADNSIARSMLFLAVGAVVFQLFNTEYFSSVMWLPLGMAIANARIKNETVL